MANVSSIIINLLKARNEKGIKKYGKTIDEGEPPTGSWKNEIIEELLDALQYSARLIKEKEKEIDRLTLKIDYLLGDSERIKCLNKK